MPQKALKILAAAALALAIYLVYFYHLTTVGIMGKDEPRYAAIGQEMALSGNWVTPRLWGEAWFEKPVLLYWMIAGAFRLGLSPDLAPRLPVALLGAGFLLFYYWVLRREFGARAALYSSLILGTCAFWIAFSQVGVTDLPMAACFSAAILLALPWIVQGDRRMLPYSAALLGLAVLAKSLVPVVLVLPLFWFGRKRLKDLLSPRVLFVFLCVALPWHIACYARNGMPFIQTLFIDHQFGRAVSNQLQHEQPFYFYLPVLLGAVFPWFILLGLLFQRRLYEDVRARYLLVTFLSGFVFFSASRNKLPGYLLPLLPALVALVGIRLAQTRFTGELLFASTLTMSAIPAAAAVLPQALATGIRGVYPLPQNAVLVAGTFIPILVMVAITQIVVARKGPPAIAVGISAGLAVCAVFALKLVVYPQLDHLLSARGRVPVCMPRDANREFRYGANYYAGTAIPACPAP